jgi:hypothetical protein
LIRDVKAAVSKILSLVSDTFCKSARVAKTKVSALIATAWLPLYVVLVRLLAKIPVDTDNEFAKAPFKVVAVSVPVILTVLKLPVVAFTVVVLIEFD